jgi:beta-glucanase (GH16 family)
MKRFFLILLIVNAFMVASFAQEHRRYALVWHDEFDSGVLDKTVWSKIWRNSADWAIHMSSSERLYAFENGDLVLRGMVNDFLPQDTAAFLTGGVWTHNKKSFGFGRLEVRAKFDVAQGFWPAIWMLPDANQNLDWPYGGEIDIMEHFRDNPYVNHTVHSHYTHNLGKRNRPSHVKYPVYNKGEYNVYGMERFHDSLVFFVNGKRTMNYPRYHEGVDGQFPFSQHDYYLILDAQLGRDRSPYIDTARLPVELRVDYVRYYELDTKTDVIPEPIDYQQYTRRRFKYRKTVVNEEETFDDPDEYHVITKQGKAIVSGNEVWAQSTLTQLIGEDGKLANVDFYDYAACPLRGISLEKLSRDLTFEEFQWLIDIMALYKLNYLKGYERVAPTADEFGFLMTYTEDLGIMVVAGDVTIPNVDVIDLGSNVELPAVDRIFLKRAAPRGGWLLLNDLGEADLDAMRAFAERYWHGGDAGEGLLESGLPDALSPAGSRLKNFNEKIAVHNRRFQK